MQEKDDFFMQRIMEGLHLLSQSQLERISREIDEVINGSLTISDKMIKDAIVATRKFNDEEDEKFRNSPSENIHKHFPQKFYLDDEDY